MTSSFIDVCRYIRASVAADIETAHWLIDDRPMLVTSIVTTNDFSPELEYSKLDTITTSPVGYQPEESAGQEISSIIKHSASAAKKCRDSSATLPCFSQVTFRRKFSLPFHSA